VKYVITLDADTQLPRDAAQEFIGTMMHPLNRPVYSKKKEHVVRGYGILQPRLGISLPSSARSGYAMLFGSEVGIDPYTRMVSDVYQDLFNEGSFIGKGIYEVDAIVKALEDRFPDNTVLSHDLIEGCYARSGLLSDLLLYEEYPSGYISDYQRRHRWIRGDWQLLPWMWPRVPTPEGHWKPNTLSHLSRWKIFDNLRRSLVAPSFVALFLVAWLSFAQPITWTVAILALLFTLPLLSSLLAIVQKPYDISMRSHLQVAMISTGQHFMRAAFGLMALPHEAYYSLDAILRTLWRMLVSRRNSAPVANIARCGASRRFLDVAHLSCDVDQSRAGRCGRGRDMAFAAQSHTRMGARSIDRAALAGGAGARALVQRAAQGSGVHAIGKTAAVFARLIAANLGFLRNVCGAGRQLASARQHAGSSDKRRGAPDVAHQYRPGVVVLSRRARFWFHHDGAVARSRQQDIADVAGHGALSRPFLQLV
jgi:hypothetical protein